MRIQVIGSFKPLTEKIIQKDKDFSKFLFDTALLLNSKIQRRVQIQGLGSDDRKMPRYSKKYENKRAKIGRQIAYRDLTNKGTMWQSLTAEKIGNGAKMFFGGAEEKTKAFHNDKKTPFFSLSPSEQVFLQKELEGFVEL